MTNSEGDPLREDAMAQAWSVWPAPAKLNLFLHIVGRRGDGYHELQTVFQLLDWGDTLRLRVRCDGAITRGGGLVSVPPEDDLTVQAARALRERCGTRLGADIELDKRIPAGAGLGGGSSDAATVLVALNELWRTGLSEDELVEVALRLGADVPVFVRGHSAWAEGIGERLTSIALPERHFVIVDPCAHVPTKALFEAPELTRNSARLTISGFLEGIATENVFAPVVRARYAPVAAAMDWLGRFGVAGLSGSGGCVFAAVDTGQQARQIAAECPAQFRAYAVRGVNRSPLWLALEQFRARRAQEC
jgi:4-diphosphocytidyl-2-C-methyl-D-erythritol kinase